MLPLDARKIRILQAIVNDYVLTTRPVGSERLIDVYKLGCKSATVRNEMAEMAEMGYLAQPHTSAGRIPTDRGYRFYVNELMDPPTALAPEDVRRAQTGYPAQNEIDEIILQTCRILSGLTQCASIATDPSTSFTALRRVYLSGASPRHVLLVALISTGHVVHRLVEFGRAPADNILSLVSGYVNSVVADSDLEEVTRRVSPADMPAEVTPHAAIASRILTILGQMAAGLLERRVYLEGASHLLRQPEFHDVQRLEILLTALEQHSALNQVFRRALLGREATVVIGSENEYEPMRDCSLILTSYRIGDRPAGYLGVVGPTRMNYDRSVAAVGLMADKLSLTLTSLSVA